MSGLASTAVDLARIQFATTSLYTFCSCHSTGPVRNQWFCTMRATLGAVMRSRGTHPVWMMLSVAESRSWIAMRPTHNWIWALGVLVVWVAVFLAFLLISISRP
jgi:hypothetical protein